MCMSNFKIYFKATLYLFFIFVLVITATISIVLTIFYQHVFIYKLRLCLKFFGYIFLEYE